MYNFSYANPVKIIFGKNTIKEISNEIPKDVSVLVVYGGGSIKKNGVYDQVSKALEQHTWFEFAGIEPNPHYETCMQVVDLIKSKGIGYILAVGGGSVIDAVKFISAATFYEGNATEILTKQVKVNKAMPFGSILTLAATGSEMNNGGVITIAKTQDKLAFSLPVTFPKFSVLDPTTTYTLPAKQTGNGVVDIFVHVAEQYLTYSEEDTLFQDNMSEAILRTLVEEGPKALKDPQSYDARANIMWASTWGLNGWIGCGVAQDWATHMIGHEMTALYGLDHGQTLAIVLPGIMTVLKDQKAKKIIRMGKQVFGITGEADNVIIDKTVKKVELFFEQMGIKTHLSDYGLGGDAATAVADRIDKRGWKLGECQNITGSVVREILEIRL
mgnify:CR=1 FL=1